MFFSSCARRGPGGIRILVAVVVALLASWTAVGLVPRLCQRRGRSWPRRDSRCSVLRLECAFVRLECAFRFVRLECAVVLSFDIVALSILNAHFLIACPLTSHYFVGVVFAWVPPCRRN